MVELKVGQTWETDGGSVAIIMKDLWGTGVLPKIECNGPGTHFKASNGMIYRQHLKRDGRYYTFSCMEDAPTDLMFLLVEAE